VKDRQSQWLPPQPVPYEPLTEPAGSPAPAPGRSGPPGRFGAAKRAGGPVVVGLVYLLSKLKFLLVALKGAKFLTTSGTMLVSIAAYALIWGWPFAAGFVALLFVHEFGHYLQLRREGVQPGRIVFIPFLGAVIGARTLGGNALAEARVGLAGPVLGSLGALAVALASVALDSEGLRALAFVGFFLNLFNLLPVVPLDGGRAMAAMAPWMWFLGLGAMIVLLLLRPNPILVLLVLFGTLETYRRWKQRKAGMEGNADYYRVAPRHRLLVGAVYVGLIVALAIGMDLTHVVRDFSDV
jgi:Zn-dependent protease